MILLVLHNNNEQSLKDALKARELGSPVSDKQLEFIKGGS